MGFDLFCNGESFSCRYTTWMMFREELANASIRYLSEVYDEMLRCEDSQTIYKTRLEQLFEYINTNNCKTLPEYMAMLFNEDFVNIFVYYNIAGVFALLYKSDEEGAYSIGNSVDIVQTMKLLKEFIEYDDIQLIYNDVQTVFEESARTRQIVVIG